VQNLIGIRIANAADHAGIGESPFESAIFRRECSAEGIEIAVEDFDAAGVNRAEAAFAAENMQRGPALGAGFGEHEAAIREVEGREAIAAGELGAWRAPMQAAGDH